MAARVIVHKVAVETDRAGFYVGRSSCCFGMVGAQCTRLLLMSARRHDAIHRRPPGPAAMGVDQWESLQGAAWAIGLDID